VPVSGPAEPCHQAHLQQIPPKPDRCVHVSGDHRQVVDSGVPNHWNSSYETSVEVEVLAGHDLRVVPSATARRPFDFAHGKPYKSFTFYQIPLANGTAGLL
jgi:hypothetical protein